MTTAVKVLIESKTAENAETTQYISSGMSTLIDKFTAMNISGVTQSITVSLVPSGQVAAAAYKVVTVAILPGKSYTFPEIVGHSLDPGDFISTLPTAASAINIRSSGRQIT